MPATAPPVCLLTHAPTSHPPTPHKPAGLQTAHASALLLADLVRQLILQRVEIARDNLVALLEGLTPPHNHHHHEGSPVGTGQVSLDTGRHRSPSPPPPPRRRGRLTTVSLSKGPRLETLGQGKGEAGAT